jgi:hypothetical protein
MKFSPVTKNEPKHALTNMSINFVSLCGAGINPLANVAFAKSEDADDGLEEFSKSAPTSSDVHVPVPLGGEEQDKKKRKRKLQKADESTLTPLHNHTLGLDSPTHPQGVHTMPDIELPDGTSADVASYVAKLEQDLLDTQDQLAKALDAIEGDDTWVEKSDDSDDIESLIEKADPALAAILRKQQDEIAKAQAEADEATELAKSIIQVASEKAAIAKAEELAPLGVETSEVAKTIAALRSIDSELAKSVEDLLDSAKVAVENSDLFAEIGNTAVTKSGPKVEAAVAEIRKSDPSLSPEQALAKAFSDHPEFYADYLAGKVA